MSYLVIARRWRPRRFEDLVGQQPIARLLKNSLEQDKLAHAYIFSGPRGVGKTSAARILARALNCERGPTAEPCGTCQYCEAIISGASMDVMEIDGASNNGVDDIRDIREQVKYAPSEGKYKVYIIDEAHMLSGPAFNALLKTLEEPPPHVIFILATTSAAKIPSTVHSRCQHLSFRRISTQIIKARLRFICDSDGISISDEALDIIARSADGSMRDSLTILDQIASSMADINESEIRELLGISDFGSLLDVSKAVVFGQRDKILEIVGELSETGTDLRAFSKELTKFFRDILVSRVVKKPSEILDISLEQLDLLNKAFSSISEEIISLMLSEIIKTESDVKFSSNPRISLEMSLIKTSYLSSLKPLNEAISNIESMLGGHMPQATSVKPRVAEPEFYEEASFDEETQDDTAAPSPSEMDEKTLFNMIKDKMMMDDPRDHAKLSKAVPTLDGDTLILTYNQTDADVFSEWISSAKPNIESIASEIAGRAIKVEIKTIEKKNVTKKDLRVQALSEPIIQNAIELFDGKLVDVKSKEGGAVSPENGG